nr:secretory carrier-associated membrane protein 3-like isoform X2 [Nicotiana tomentosiformis]
MARFNENPFAEEANVNPFANTGGAARGSTIDIPLDSAKDLKKKEKELQAREADLRRREQLSWFLIGSEKERRGLSRSWCCCRGKELATILPYHSS